MTTAMNTSGSTGILRAIGIILSCLISLLRFISSPIFSAIENRVSNTRIHVCNYFQNTSKLIQHIIQLPALPGSFVFLTSPGYNPSGRSGRNGATHEDVIAYQSLQNSTTCL